MSIFCNEFRKNYFNIKKLRVSLELIENVKTVKDYRNYLILSGISAKGGEKAIYKEIERLAIQGIFKYPKSKYRLRSELKKITNNIGLTSVHPLALELDKKFEEAFQNELNSLKSRK